jgi:hypothetical protein
VGIVLCGLSLGILARAVTTERPRLAASPASSPRGTAREASGAPTSTFSGSVSSTFSRSAAAHEDAAPVALAGPVIAVDAVGALVHDRERGLVRIEGGRAPQRVAPEWSGRGRFGRRDGDLACYRLEGR